MDNVHAVIPTAPTAYRRQILHEEKRTHLPISLILWFSLFFLVGILLYHLLSPSPDLFSCGSLDHFLCMLSAEKDDLPRFIFMIFDSYKFEGLLLFLAFLFTLTFLSPILCSLLCAFYGLTTGVAATHTLLMARIGALSTMTCTLFLCKEAIFCAILVFFSSRSLSLSRRLSGMSFRRFFVICQLISAHFIKIAICYLLFLTVLLVMFIIL